ncbi:MAG: hypothetical protein AAGC44_08625 [Planctomycetota bacterium]
MSRLPRILSRPTTLLWSLAAVSLLFAVPASANEPTPVDDRDEQALVASSIRAFHTYLRSVDKPDLVEARSYVLDPGDAQGRARVLELLLGFVRGRSTGDIHNEGVVVKTQGDWALAVYQYDTTIAGKTTRIITTAWMIQWEGVWKQFIVAPSDETFWNTRESDYRELQNWFDDHAKEIGS